MNKKFSIIIPIYNGEKFIDKCLISWLNQDYKNFEVLLINDGSQDNTATICDNYAQKDNRIKVFHTENRGVSHARNIGLIHATGDIIGFCDIDDFVSSQMLNLVIKEFNDTTINIVTVGYKSIKVDEAIDIQATEENESIICSAEELVEKAIYNQEIGGFLWNKFFIKEFVTSKFAENLTHLEDLEWILKNMLTLPSVKCKIISNKLYYYVQHNNNVTRNENKLYDEYGKLKYISACENMLKNNRLPLNIKRLLKCSLLRYTINSLYKKRVNEEKELIKLRNYINEYYYIYMGSKDILSIEKLKISVKLCLLILKGNYTKLNK